MDAAPRRRSADLLGTYSVGERFGRLEGKVDALDSRMDRLTGAIVIVGVLIGILEPIVLAVLEHRP